MSPVLVRSSPSVSRATPEIHQFGAAPSVRDDQVGRLDVPVDHLAGMRVIKRFADVDPDLPDFPVADQVPVHQLPHRVPVDQFRNKIGPPPSGRTRGGRIRRG